MLKCVQSVEESTDYSEAPKALRQKAWPFEADDMLPTLSVRSRAPFKQKKSESK